MTGSRVVAAFAATLAALAIPTQPAQAATKQQAIRVLNSLPVSAESRVGYDRDLFRHWSDLDGNGCDTRDDVLAAEALAGVRRGCDVTGGRWVSAYDGAVTTDPSRFDIDHVVALGEAWDSGAWRWDAATRERFANDLAYPLALIAVSASSNRSKGDRDPAEWLPARGRCAFAKSWVGVKYRWRLSVDTSEKTSLARILRSCPPLMTVPALARTTEDPGAGRTPTPAPAPVTGGAGLDPRFRTCGDANAAGFGPYVAGQDREYDWYIDRDRDGVACES